MVPVSDATYLRRKHIQLIPGVSPLILALCCQDEMGRFVCYQCMCSKAFGKQMLTIKYRRRHHTPLTNFQRRMSNPGAKQIPSQTRVALEPSRWQPEKNASFDAVNLFVLRGIIGLRNFAQGMWLSLVNFGILPYPAESLAEMRDASPLQLNASYVLRRIA